MSYFARASDMTARRQADKTLQGIHGIASALVTTSSEAR